MTFHTLSHLEHRKGPFGATFGTGRTSVMECPSSRVRVDFFPSSCSSFFFFFLLSHVLLARQQDILQAAAQDEIRVPITFLPALVASPLQLSFLLHLSTRLLGQRLLTRTVTMQQPHTSFSTYYSLSFVACTPFCLISIAGTPRSPYHTKPRPS